MMKLFFSNRILPCHIYTALWLVGWLMSATCHGDNFPIPVQVNQSGIIEAGKTVFTINHWGEQWRRTPQSAKSIIPKSGYPQKQQNDWILEGIYRTNAGDWKIKESLTRARDVIRYHAILEPEEKIITIEMALSTVIPIKRLEGHPILWKKLMITQ